ncbi:hypothetical protein OTU49_010892, partial [Cherax quadricarinatus]
GKKGPATPPEVVGTVFRPINGSSALPLQPVPPLTPIPPPPHTPAPHTPAVIQSGGGGGGGGGGSVTTLNFSTPLPQKESSGSERSRSKEFPGIKKDSRDHSKDFFNFNIVADTGSHASDTIRSRTPRKSSSPSPLVMPDNKVDKPFD